MLSISEEYVGGQTSRAIKGLEETKDKLRGLL
jgi:hypothetical protein